MPKKIAAPVAASMKKLTEKDADALAAAVVEKLNASENPSECVLCELAEVKDAAVRAELVARGFVDDDAARELLLDRIGYGLPFETDRDARLHAAASELLEVLGELLAQDETMMAHLERHGMPTADFHQRTKIQQKARAIIKKAG